MSMFPTKILAAVDGSENAGRAATVAAGLAKATGSELHVATVGFVPAMYPYRDLSSAEWNERARRETGELLQKEVEKLRKRGLADEAETHIRLGAEINEIVDLAEEIGAGLIVVGSRGLGPLKRVLIGSVSLGVVRHAHCPVLVVRPGAREDGLLSGGEILAAVDGSEAAAAASRVAAEVAGATGSKLHVACALPLDPQLPYTHPLIGERFEWSLEREKDEVRKFVEDRAKELAESGGVEAEAHLLLGRPDHEIVGFAEKIGADLIVVGSRGLKGLRRALVGSVSDSVVRHAHCSVLVVR